jgi:hypothetical protein
MKDITVTIVARGEIADFLAERLLTPNFPLRDRKDIAQMVVDQDPRPSVTAHPSE